MYHEEKIIDGILHWRGLPNAEFRLYTLEQLTEKNKELRKELQSNKRQTVPSLFEKLNVKEVE